tara:strand:- start:2476 stop:3351 length:876 start_codon:yes stop_codon:yes gene_type:complete
MAKFSLEDYELVKDRLKRFWKDYPNGRVHTEVVGQSDDGTMVIVRAEIYKDYGDTEPVTTGLAQETQGVGGFATDVSWLEVAETSALGRALANWKYQGDNKPRPSREEMIKAQGSDVKETKVEKKPATKEEATALNDSTSKFAADIGAEYTVADQLNVLLEEMIPDGRSRNATKKRVHTQAVDKGYPADVEEWNEKQMDSFLSMIEEDMDSPIVSEKEIVADTFGDVKDRSIELQVCPECNKVGNIEDNRGKKASDDRFKNIPDFACSTYQKDGCGKGWWIGNEDLPSEWI